MITGAVEASGGIDTRVANGAVVCGMREAFGSHGACGSSGVDFVDAALLDGLSASFGGFSARLLALTLLSLECFNGLLVRRISVSRSRTSRFSVRRSPDVAPVPLMSCDCDLRVWDVVEDCRRSPSSPLVAADATRGRAVDV